MNIDFEQLTQIASDAACFFFLVMACTVFIFVGTGMLSLSWVILRWAMGG